MVYSTVVMKRLRFDLRKVLYPRLLLISRASIAGLVLGLLFFAPAIVQAQYSSSNYKIEEAKTGSGSDDNLSSTNYQGAASAGSLGNGRITSASYAAEAGFLTPNEPFLEFVVNTSSVALGTLSSSTTATGTASFYVRAYVNGGYTVQAMGNPPTQESGATLSNLTSPTASSAGTEQFGINLVANTSPTTFGAAPSQSPDNTFAAGQAATGYNTTNLFKYVKGDVIAQATSSGWGKTDFTISYIANINPITKAGRYLMNQDLVVVATY